MYAKLEGVVAYIITQLKTFIMLLKQGVADLEW
jgi:hypothetical protein